ncbi:MAG: hypothetical protein JRI23_28325, partial [Deltaproteobacteria bacterium]|nr:hypothetical protein [Deltaproteobacteria bacterium]MBW2536005.1 hypothetical protein [Deltaproteobacteria bacterium]
MGETRTDRRTREVAKLLSVLTFTPDSALTIFRDRRAADPDLDPERLKHARDLLDAVGHAILDADHDRWSRLRNAWKLIERDARVAPEMPEEPAELPPAEIPAPVAAPNAPTKAAAPADLPEPHSPEPAPGP